MNTSRAVREGWKCDACGQIFSNVGEGWVEWLAGEDEHGAPRVRGLRLVHRFPVGPLNSERPGCRYNDREEFKTDRSIAEGLELERFVGPDGLMLLLSLIADSELPTGELLELTKRVQIPGYEQVRDLFRDAVNQGVVEPSIGDGYYLQSEIQTVLGWATEADSPHQGEQRHADDKHCGTRLARE